MYTCIISWGQQSYDYTRYVDWKSVSIQESINIPTTCTFNMYGVDRGFQIPPARSYVQIYSSVYDRSLFTGFMIQQPVFNYLAPKPGEASDGFKNSIGQWFQYQISCTSDEYLLNIKATPFIPAYVNRTQGQILTDLANILCPGFFDTSNIMDGDIVPYFAYSPTQGWSEIAKQFGDGTRFRYHARDKQLWYVPYGDLPLGIKYDEINDNTKLFDPKALQTQILSVPVVNDVTIVGDIEAGNNREDYFIGDGFSANFALQHQVFRGASTLLLQESWSNNQLNTQQWNLQDDGQAGSGPGNNFDFSAGALNIVTSGSFSPGNFNPPYPFQLGESYLAMNNGIELGGSLNLEAGECTFNDSCEGMIGGIYSGTGVYLTGVYSAFTVDDLLGAFYIHTPSSGAVIGASGAAGISIQPWWAGMNAAGTAVASTSGMNVSGVQVVTQANHTYVLQMLVSAPVYSRYTRLYRTLDGEQYGGGSPTTVGSVTWTIQDYDIIQASGFYYTPNITKVTLTGVVLPSFALYALANNQALNVTIDNTTVGLMPLGTLWANVGPSGLIQPTGAILPMLPDGTIIAGSGYTSGNILVPSPIPGHTRYLGPVQDWPGNPAQSVYPAYSAIGFILNPPGVLQGWQQEVMGNGFSLQVAQVTAGNEADTLAFYAQTAPAAGTPIRFQSWESQAAVSRVQNPVSISGEAYVVGDDGIRSAIVTDLNPLPRTSEDCDNAATAFLADRGGTFYNGTYTVTSYPKGAPYFRGLTSDLQFYPCCGRFLSVNTPRRGIYGQQYLVTQLTTTIVEAMEEVTQWQISFGADLYLEKILKNFVDLAPPQVLYPKDTANPPVPRALADVSTSYLPDIVNMVAWRITDNLVSMLQNTAVIPFPVEVRTVDNNWGLGITYDYVGTFTGPWFTLRRTQYTNTWFMRYVNGQILQAGVVSVTNGSKTVNWVSGAGFNPAWGPGIALTISGQFYPVNSTTETVLTLQSPYTGATNASIAYTLDQIFTSRRSKVIRVQYPNTPTPPAVFSVTPGAIAGDAGQIQFNFTGDQRSIYGLEVRSSDDAVILWQAPAFSFANMLVDLSNNTPYASPGVLTDIQAAVLKAYFFNHQWSYSLPTIVVPQPFGEGVVVYVNAPYTFDPTLNIGMVEIDTSAGPFTIALCDVNLVQRTVVFKKISTENPPNTCILQAIMGQTIENESQYLLVNVGDSASLTGQQATPAAGIPTVLTIETSVTSIEPQPNPLGPYTNNTGFVVFVTSVGDASPGQTMTIAGNSDPYNGTWTISHVDPGSPTSWGLLWVAGLDSSVLSGAPANQLGGTITLGP